MSALPPLATFPTLKTPGWDGARSPAGLPTARILSFEEFCAPQSSDALAVAYTVPRAKTFPLLTMAALPSLLEAGQEPLLTWAIFDVDNPAHAPHKSPAAARESLARALVSTGGTEAPWGGYTTRHGLRLMVPLDPPLPVRFAGAFLAGLADRLALAGVEVDRQCLDWTRRYYLPLAVRDGEAYAAEIVSPADALNPYALGIDLVEGAGPAPKAAGPVPEAHELPWEDRRHAAGFDWLLRGDAIPPDETGSSFRAARTTLAILAERGRYEDPEILWSFIAESARNTRGSSAADPDQLWPLCEWIAARQEESNAAADEHDPDHLPAPGTPTEGDWLSIAKALRGKDSKYLNKLKDGTPLAYHKSRYTETTWAVARLLLEGTSLPPDTVYRALSGSVTAQQEPLLPEVWEKILEVAEERTHEGDADDQTRRAFCALHPLTLSTLTGRLYQLDTRAGTYVLTSESLIEHHFETLTRPGLPFEADYTGLPLRTILARYGRGVDAVTYVSGRRGISYDAVENRVVEGVHHLARVSPVYHAEVDTWLRLLGGTDPEALLDWLACVTYTHDQPICALYLRGAPGGGKTLLARGVASLWSSAPVDYNVVANQSFNAELLYSPLLLADEGVVVDRNNAERASLTFRNLISGQGIGVNAKYKDVTPMVAALRVMVCANNADGLPFRESLGRDGVDAITQRVMYLSSGDEPREFLESLGGRQAIKGWAPEDCTPGKIAEHLTWLRENRTVVPGRRFLVEGRPTAWHRQYAARQGIKPYVLQVVWGVLEAASRGQRSLRAERDGAVVWVAKADIVAQWRAYTEARTPKPAEITDALDQLSCDKTRRRVNGNDPAPCYAIPIQAFHDADVLEAEPLTPGD